MLMMSLLRQVFRPGIILGILLLGMLMTLGMLGLLWLTRPAVPLTRVSTADLNIIRVPTVTPTAAATVVVETPTPESLDDPSGSIAIGSYVMVSGTGGDGLRVRPDAGLGQGVRFLAGDGEIFVVQDGPVEIDGYTWWYLVKPDDAARSGWAVDNFLQVVNAP
jgi:hypothetical protein